MLEWSLLLMLVFPTVVFHPDEFDDVIRLLWTGQTETAITGFRALGQRGDVRAQLFLGRIYSGSRIHAADYDEAIKWFRIASAQGSGEASAAIADLYYQGQGVPRDEKEAAKWYEEAASQGWDQQELQLTALRWNPVPEGPLQCQSICPLIKCPIPADMGLLRNAGLHGVIQPDGRSMRSRPGPKAHLFVVAWKPITSEVHLRQPRHATAVWIQTDTDWRIYPPDTPLSERDIVIAPQADQPRFTTCNVKDVDGSVTGGGCLTWPEVRR